MLILLTFAVGGSLCGRAGQWLLNQAGIDSPWLWWPLYFILVTLLWPMCVLLISIPLGQTSFFLSYLGKVWNRIRRR